MRFQPGPLILLFASLGNLLHGAPASGKRPLRPGFLGIAVVVPEADADKLDEAGRVDVTAVCPAGGADPAREERIVPFRGVPIGSFSRRGGSAVVELHFPYGYDGLYTVLMHKACRELRLVPAPAASSSYVAKGDVPMMAWMVGKPEELGPPPIAPREGQAAVILSVDESQIRFVEPGDNVDIYFVCSQWPKYMARSEKEWVSLKPANVIRVLDVSLGQADSNVTLEASRRFGDFLREVARDCTLFLARRAPGDHSSAGMTGVTLTGFGFGQRWGHWSEEGR